MANSANLRIGPGRASGSRTARTEATGGEDGDTHWAKSACQAAPAVTSQGVPRGDLIGGSQKAQLQKYGRLQCRPVRQRLVPRWHVWLWDCGPHLHHTLRYGAVRQHPFCFRHPGPRRHDYERGVARLCQNRRRFDRPQEPQSQDRRETRHELAGLSVRVPRSSLNRAAPREQRPRVACGRDQLVGLEWIRRDAQAPARRHAHDRIPCARRLQTGRWPGGLSRHLLHNHSRPPWSLLTDAAEWLCPAARERGWRADAGVDLII